MMRPNRAVDGIRPESRSRCLYVVGGVAALIAGVVFRRNIAAEIGLISQTPAPATVHEWFALLQSNRILGLTYLHIFDVVNYALLGLMLLALYEVLSRVNRSLMIIASALGLVGIAVYFASNTALSMLSLSSQYATAATEIERSLLLAAGQSMLAIGRFTGSGAHPGSGGYMSLLLIAAASLLVSAVMLQSKVFKRATAYVGFLASALDIAYCFAFPFVAASNRELLAVSFIPAAGLLLMIWHIMTGLRLYQLARTEEKPVKAGT